MLIQELSKVRVPSRYFKFGQRIWFPSDWVIKKVQYGETDVIPTVVTEEPRSLYFDKSDDKVRSRHDMLFGI